MKRLIDADIAYKVLTDYYHIRTEFQHKALKEAMERVPTVDAVEVVHCENCKWFHVHKTAIWCEEERGLNHPKYDSFCSYGERRNDA